MISVGDGTSDSHTQRCHRAAYLSASESLQRNTLTAFPGEQRSSSLTLCDLSLSNTFAAFSALILVHDPNLNLDLKPIATPLQQR
jgi:hypothetical protein